MNRRRIFGLLGIALILCVLVFPMVGFAQTQTVTAPRLNVPIPGLDFRAYPVLRTGNKISIPFFAAYISTANKYLVGISAIAAAIMIVYGGFLYIVGSSLGSVKRGRAIIVDAVVGLILILGTYVILNTINPDLLNLNAITMQTIPRQEYTEALKNGDMSPTDHERIGGPSPANANSGSVPLPSDGSPTGNIQLTGTNTDYGKMCGKDPSIKVPEARPCADREDCYQKFCVNGQKAVDLPGFPKDTDLKKFDDFPRDAATQINQYGIAFIGLGGFGLGVKKQISTLKVASVTEMQLPYYAMLPDAHDALLKAGQIAKSRGYFIIPTVMYRQMIGQVTAFCDRVKQLKAQNLPGTGGLALPGGSSHQYGYATDAVLGKINGDGTVSLVSTGGPVCNPDSGTNQIDNAVAFGLENAKILQEIMAEAGFKRLCSEMWHFDYKGVYGEDCGECNFPPKYRDDLGNCRGKVKYCKDHATEGSCKQLL